jgi:hypothetical protein
MKRSLATVSVAALALGLVTIEPVEAHPVLLLAPAAAGGISAGWAVALGVGSLALGTLIGATAANNHWWGAPAYAAPVAYAPDAYAAAAPANGAAPIHCYVSHRWIGGVRQAVRVCVQPLY